MTEQTCPLCGEEREVYNILGHPRYKCHNIDCILCGKEILYQTNKQYQSQIARIRQEAKQEVFDDFPYNFDPRFENEIRKLNPVLDIDKIIKWKKKHGVE